MCSLHSQYSAPWNNGSCLCVAYVTFLPVCVCVCVCGVRVRVCVCVCVCVQVAAVCDLYMFLRHCQLGLIKMDGENIQ